jgi:hypothetical protein
MEYAVWEKENTLRYYRDHSLAAFSIAEFDLPGNEREQRVIFRDADVQPGMYARTALTDEHRPGLHHLAVKSFNAQAFPGRIPAVLGRTRTFFMRHIFLLLKSFAF